MEPVYREEDDDDLITNRIKCPKCGISLTILQNSYCKCCFYEDYFGNDEWDDFESNEEI